MAVDLSIENREATATSTTITAFIDDYPFFEVWDIIFEKVELATIYLGRKPLTLTSCWVIKGNTFNKIIFH